MSQPANERRGRSSSAARPCRARVCGGAAPSRRRRRARTRARGVGPAESRDTATTRASGCATCVACFRVRAYADRHVRAALEAGCALACETMVTGWSPDGGLQLTGPARALPRLPPRPSCSPPAAASARGPRVLIPGSRPRGVMNTGTLQQLVHARQAPAGQGARRRRRARQLLRRDDAAPCRGRGRGADHRAAPPAVAAAGGTRGAGRDTGRRCGPGPRCARSKAAPRSSGYGSSTSTPAQNGHSTASWWC